nr:hypothetical protein GCM10020241_15240 [Streptoalloteichus tenebrarius]
MLHETVVRRIGANLLRSLPAEGPRAARRRQSLPALGSRLRSSPGLWPVLLASDPTSVGPAADCGSPLTLMGPVLPSLAAWR